MRNLSLSMVQTNSKKQQIFNEQTNSERTFKRTDDCFLNDLENRSAFLLKEVLKNYSFFRTNMFFTII